MSIHPGSSPSAQAAPRGSKRLLLYFLAHLPQRLEVSSAQKAQGDRGLTLIECLVAVVVIAITLVAITPQLFFITATRVQSRKAEQALQVAQAEIDRVRAVVERGVYTASELPDVVTSIDTAAAPTSIASVLKSANSNSSCNTYTGATVLATSLLPVNTDIDPANAATCSSQFLVQTFRTAGPAGSSVPTSGFRMGVRVYTDNPLLRQNLSSLQTTQASLKFVSGLGNQDRRPLAVLYSTVVRNDTGSSLQDYRTTCPTAGGC